VTAKPLVAGQARIAQIKAQIEETTSDYDKEKLQERVHEVARHRAERLLQAIPPKLYLAVGRVGLEHVGL
jgi:hypothetical protein